MGTSPPTDRASRGQKFGAGLAFCAALALCGISATLNFRFGYSLGRQAVDGYVYGAAAVCADALKVLAPFMLFAAWRSNSWSHFIAAGAVWVVMTAFALTGAVGHLSLNRSEVSAHREVASTNYADLRDEQKRLKQAIAWIPAHRPAASIDADMRGQQLSRAWSATRGCTDATAPASREFCLGYQKLAAELASAKEAAALQARLDKTSEKLQALGGAADADPQAQALSRASGLDVTMVQTLLIMLCILMLEIGSGLAPYGAVAMLRAPVAKLATEETRVAKAATDGKSDDRDDDTGAGPPPVETTVVQFPKPAPAATVATSPRVETPAIAGVPPPPAFPVDRDTALDDLKKYLASVGTIPAASILVRRWGVRADNVTKWLQSEEFCKHVKATRVGRFMTITGASNHAAA